MAIQRINYGAVPDDGTGDPLRVAFKKSDDNLVDLDNRKAEQQDVADALAGKVDKVTGKQLSTNDYTTAEKNKLDGVQDNATYNRPDSETDDALALKADQTAVDDALALKADQTAVAQAIAMAATFAAVPATFQAPVIIVTTPHFRLMQWGGTKYVRCPLGPMPGVYFYAHDPLGKITHGIQVRTDVTYNTADHPDLAEYLGVVGSTFVLPGDGRARVLRAADNGRGIDTALVNGYLQEDAIRNLSGVVARSVTNSTVFENDASSGPFFSSDTNFKYANLESIVTPSSPPVYPRAIEFDASRQVPTAAENRVKSLVATLYMTR